MSTEPMTAERLQQIRHVSKEGGFDNTDMKAANRQVRELLAEVDRLRDLVASETNRLLPRISGLQEDVMAARNQVARLTDQHLESTIARVEEAAHEARRGAIRLRDERDNARAAIARVEALCTYWESWRPSSFDEAAGELRAALAVTAPPTECDHADSLYGRCTACGKTWEQQAAPPATLQDQDWAFPEKPVSTPLGAGVIEGLRYDETGNEWWAVRVNGKVELFRPDELAPPETPGEKLLRDIFTDETQRSLWQVKLISTGVLLTLPKKMAETQALADALEAAGHDIELVRVVPATPVEEDRP